MPHTFPVHALLRSCAIFAATAFVTCNSTAAATWQAAVDEAAYSAPDARILVLDLGTGHLIASHHLNEAGHTLSTPGSTLKPLVLYQLLINNQWDPNRRIACDRKLAVAGHRLACTHPAAPPFDAREALTWSCNTYFANVARSLQPGELGRLLRPTGLLSVTGIAGAQALAESAAEFREPSTTESAQLALLGVEGIRVTPLELAVAYRWLALKIAAHPDSPATQVVLAGVADSASFGMARQASSGAVSIAGKTGTAEGTTSAQTHGWFAGLAPADNPTIVVVVYLPAGRGADAAGVAANLLAHSPLANVASRPR